MQTKRRGFTLIDLLVVLAVIGLLLGLLFCGIQKAREIADLARCGNHLHQIGVAMHAYHAVYQTFPCEDLSNQQLLLYVLLLPYLEEEKQVHFCSKPVASFMCPARRGVDVGRMKDDFAYASQDSLADPALLPILGTSKGETYFVQADFAFDSSGLWRLRWHSIRQSESEWVEPPFTDFGRFLTLGIFPAWRTGENEPCILMEEAMKLFALPQFVLGDTLQSAEWYDCLGVLSCRFEQSGSRQQVVAISIDRVTVADGTSATLMLSHKELHATRYGGGDPNDPGWTAAGNMWDHVRAAHAQPVQDSTAVTAGYRFGSPHAAFVPSLFADGSVRGVAYSISVPAWQALWSWNGREPVELP